MQRIGRYHQCGETFHRIKGGCSVIEVPGKVTSLEMKDAKQANPTISEVVQYVKAANEPKLSQIRTAESNKM